MSMVQSAMKEVAKLMFACSKASARFWDEKSPQRCIDHSQLIERRKALACLIDDYSPDIIVVGTTGDLSIDKWAVELARQRGIKTIGILDEWYDYASRFDWENSKDRFLPDVVLCQDEFALNEATLEGLPENRLSVCTLPLINNCEFSSKCYDDISTNETNILFISETHSRDYGAVDDGHGELGPFLGYSEISVRRDLFTFLEHLHQRVNVVEKIHPSSTNSYEEFESENSLSWRLDVSGDLVELIRNAHIVIGMRSAVLFQALSLGAKVVSYQPGLIGANKCTASRRFKIPSFFEKQTFVDWLTSFIEDPSCYSCDEGREELRTLVEQSKYGYDRLRSIILNHMGV